MLFQVFQASLLIVVKSINTKRSYNFHQAYPQSQMKKIKSQLLQANSGLSYPRESFSFPTSKYTPCHPNWILTKLTGPFLLGLGQPAWPGTKGKWRCKIILFTSK